MSDKIKFAVVGSGHIGLRHAEMVRRNPEAELVGVCDILPGPPAQITEWGVPYFSSSKEMLAALPDIDVVNICTPNGLHATNALEALNSKKHVVLEKPMALSKADCEKIIFKALQVHKNVFCVMQNRYSPPSAWLKELVEKKIIGDVFMVQLVCYWNRDDRYYKTGGWKGTADLDGGTLFTQFSHFIDIMYWVFGDITDIQGKFADFNHHQSTAFEDSGMVSFRFLNGGMGSINYSTSVWDKNMESSITVVGSKGTVKIGGQYMNEVEYCHIKDYEMPQLGPVNPANDYGAYKGSAANHHYIISNVIDTIKGRTSITTNALEGLKVVDIIERIYALRNNNKSKQ
ncbi:MAG TPA: Gfo/Idh/MocA family oxidoreductase [Bacteroidia bacterium]|nr:Gfo/Idh/MocA family oxidoreductase [Bacteroidia bacterium]